MADFISGIVTVITQLFTGLLQMLAGLGELIFVIGESGISGLTPFGWLTVVLIGIPLATWVFGKALGIFNRIFKRN